MTTPTPSMKPFLKWVGGKTQILDSVLALFPETVHNYHEPFVGGGSVLLGFLSRIKAGTIRMSGTVYASDLNPNLIALYKAVQEAPDALIAEVKGLAADFAECGEAAEPNRKPTTIDEAKSSQESFYYWIRSLYNAIEGADRSSPTASAMFLFLNKTCFRGVYREGPRGFNVPFGHYKNPGILDEDHIRAVSALLQGVVFSVAPFQEALGRVGRGDFVYLDPPYAPETATSFVGYTAEGFALEDHQTLFGACDNVRVHGAGVLMSNADVKLVKDAFPAPAWTTTVVSCRRAINSKKPESRTNEVLIRG